MKKNLYLKALNSSSPEKLSQIIRRPSDNDVMVTPPQNETESLLLNIFKRILNIGQLGVTANLISEGLTSLKIVQAISLIKKEIGADLTFEDFLENPDIVSLAKITQTTRLSDHQAIHRQADQDSYELSHAQRRMWLAHNVEGQTLIYNITTPYLIGGKLDYEALSKAFEAMENRHESLRTVFPEREGGPTQVIKPPSLRIAIPVLDLTGEASPEETAKEIAAQDGKEPFNLDKGPLYRTKLLKLSQDQHVFILVIHHLITDGLSMEVFLRDLTLYYLHYCGEVVELPQPLSIQYRDYAVWEQRALESPLYETHKAYWLSEFENAKIRNPLRLLADFPWPAKRKSGKTVKCELSQLEMSYLDELRTRSDTTIFMTLFALLNATMYRLTGQDELIIGFPVSGRSHPLLDQQIGLYINTIASKTTFDEEESFQSLIEQVRTNVLRSLNHRSYPFNRLIMDLRRKEIIKNDESLFDMMVSFQEVPEETWIGKDITISKLDFDSSVSMFDLSFDFYRSLKSIYVKIEYNTDIFELDTIMLFFEQFKLLIGEAYNKPESALSALNPDIPAMKTGNDLSFDLDL